jgi:two-component system LytT family sensor kinase
MHFSFSRLDYKKQALIAEVLGLFILGVVIPFSNGMQLWSKYTYVFSLVFATLLTFPAIILFYRWYVPITMGKKRFGTFFIFFPLYLIVYEANVRLASLLIIHLPFIPAGYRNNLAMAHPENFSVNYFNQNFGYTCLILFAAGSLCLVKNEFRNNHRLYTLENDKLMLELNQLKSQLQPHFFFNTLNNLYALSTQNSPKTSSMIANLSAIMRYVLYDSSKEKVPLKNEIDFLNSYISLERIRHDNPGIIDFDVQGDIDSLQIEPLLFLPLVENCFKHALAKDIPNKYVKMALVVDDEQLIFQTTNPVSKKASNPATVGGIGLTNLAKRMELLYPGAHQLDIEQDKETFTVILIIRF